MKFFENIESAMEEIKDVIQPLDAEDNIAHVLDDTSDLPPTLIITGLDPDIYHDPEKKKEFESIFTAYDDQATFHYFRSFHRARVNFTSTDAAAAARIHSHHTYFGDYQLSCYFAQPVQCPEGKSTTEDGHLRPPTPDRQFLISPPASPPVGWAPVDEAQPCINYDLLAAISEMAPGETHELHPPSESYPGIYVHVCEDGRIIPEKNPAGVKIAQTPCPPRDKTS